MSLLSLMKRVDAEKAGFHKLTEDEKNRIQELLLEALNDISDCCKKNSIRWSMSGGSILGAIRHKGFIPWDDDADIFMTRENFEKLKKCFNESLGDKYELKVPGDKGYLMHYPQIYIKDTVAQLIQSTGKTEDRVFIDIFLLENTFDNKLLRLLHGILSTALLFIDSSVRVYECADNLIKCDDGSGQIVREVKKRKIISAFFRWRSLEKWLKLSDRVFSMKKKSGTYVVCPSGAKHFFGEIFDRTKMCKLKKVPFENSYVYVPEDYDYYLTIRYGDDYMTPPPQHDMEKHVYVRLKLK